MELRRHAVGVVIRRYGGMEAGCKRADMEAFASRAPGLRRCAAGVASKEVWSSGGALSAWRQGGLEVRCRRGDVEV